jgi:hypothetical protein
MSLQYQAGRPTRALILESSDSNTFARPVFSCRGDRFALQGRLSASCNGYRAGGERHCRSTGGAGDRRPMIQGQDKILGPCHRITTCNSRSPTPCLCQQPSRIAQAEQRLGALNGYAEATHTEAAEGAVPPEELSGALYK